MSDIVVVLGPVAFSDFEIPERLHFGGAQRLAVHAIPGGLRVIDALGRDDSELTWSGIFAGPDATERAGLLDLLRVQGAVLPLTWDVFFYTVVIATLEMQYCKPWWIPYRLSCTVLRDDSQPVPEVVPPLEMQSLSDLGAAATLASGSGIDFSVVQTALATPGAIIAATAAYAAARSAVGQVQMQVGSGIAAAEAQMTAIGATAIPLGIGAATVGASAIQQATGAAAQLGALTAAMGYIGRTAANLANVQS